VRLEVLRGCLSVIYTVGVFGALLQVVGGYWDVAWHILGIVETFFTPPHTILYTGIALALVASVMGVLMGRATLRHDLVRRPLVRGLQIAFVGGILQLIAGPADYWWHDTFGFDPFLFTPAHILLISGIMLVGIGMALGAVRLLPAKRAGVDLGRPLASGPWIQVLDVIGLAALWIVLNTFVYLVTDVSGIAYTFGLNESVFDSFLPAILVAIPMALALTGTLVLLSARRILGRFGGATAVAALAAAISATANLGFRAIILAGTPEGSALASFIPVYLALLVPVALFDWLVRPSTGGAKLIAAAALIGPAASYLDGWHSAIVSIDAPIWFVYYLGPTMIAGALAGALHGRFASALLARRARDLRAKSTP